MRGGRVVDEEGARLERIWLSLRTRRGLPRRGWTPEQEARIGDWVERGWAEYTEEGVRLTVSGWLLLDRLAVEFDAAAAVATA